MNRHKNKNKEKGGWIVKKKIFAYIMATAMLIGISVPAFAEEYDFETDDVSLDVDAFNEISVSDIESADAIEIAAPSAILMEKETGQVIYEKNADERLRPASVTKVMTILLIVEEIEKGTISLEDMVTVSAYASSMGGSQIYLEEGEQMSVSDMLKSIIVSSANDAAVAMAEYIAGSESAFVERMNGRAAELGMENTLFMNCTGLLDQAEHLTTARDIAIMSRELIKYDWIKEYTTIWMDTVRDGSFGLSNTNKLIYYYSGATGLKTGFTSEAGYCLSATAERDGVEYIAVVMNCETSQNRFESAKTMLSYAFGAYGLYSVTPDEALPPVCVDMGEKPYIQPVYEGNEKILMEKSKISGIEKTVELNEKISAPVEKGQVLGKVTVKSGDEIVYEGNLVADEAVSRLSTWQIFCNLLSFVFRSRTPYSGIKM